MYFPNLKTLLRRALFGNAKQTPIRRTPTRRPARLQVEQLEDRTVPTGVSMVKDIIAGAGAGNPLNFANVNGTLFFGANDNINGQELWKSDGTAAGTVLVKDINPSGNSSPRDLVNVNGTLFFTADDGTNGRELWKSDGTAAGTVLVKDINPSGISSPDALTNVNGTLFFSASDGFRGLWKSDGTTAGTIRIRNIEIDDTTLTNVNGTLFFRGDDGANGYELWKSDGTAAGTVLVKDINATGESLIAYLTNVSGTLYFRADDGSSGVELWKSDGTAGGTGVVKDIRPGGDGSLPGFLTNVNGTLFFSANDGTSGDELWKSDGTAAGTVLVMDIDSAGNSGPESLTNVNGTLFFVADDNINGDELWKSDGTAAGTVLVKDIDPGSDSTPTFLQAVNGALFFSANDGTNGRELWKSDGTTAGTVLVQDIRPGGDSSDPQDWTNVNGALFVSANDGVNGRELWKVTEFYDDFEAPDSSLLGAHWTEVAGDLAIADQTVTAVGTGVSLGGHAGMSAAAVNSVSLKDVRVTTEFAALTTGNSVAAVFARAKDVNNAYVAAVYRSEASVSGVYVAELKRIVGGVASVIASKPVMLEFGEGVLRFEIVGTLLKLFVNDVLTVSAMDRTLELQYEGKAGVAGTEFVSFDNFFISRLDPELPFGDSFDRNVRTTSLGSQWRELSGDLAVLNNQVVAKGAKINLGVYTGASLSDVRVQAHVKAFPFGGSAGVVARYVSPTEYFSGAIVGIGGSFQARIFYGGKLLAAAPVPHGSAHLRFEVVGDSAKLVIDDTITIRATERFRTASGLVGVRGTSRATFDRFSAEALSPTLMFDGFNRGDSSTLGAQWQSLKGDFGIASNKAQATVAGANITVVSGISRGNVKLETQVVVLGAGVSEAGLVARLKDASNYYYAALDGNNGAFSVSIYKVVNNVKTRIGSASSVGSGAGKLRFEVSGNSLKLFFDDALAVDVTDSTFANAYLTGGAGLRGSQNTTFDNFTMS